MHDSGSDNDATSGKDVLSGLQEHQALGIVRNGAIMICNLPQMRNQRRETIAVRVIGMIAALMVGMIGQSQSQTGFVAQPRFEVASVRLSPPDARFTSFSAPGEMTFTARDASLMGLLVTAFGVTEMQVAGLPKWSESTKYDVVAKPEGEKPLDDVQLKQALQQLLKERLHLAVHHEMRQVKGYTLVVAKGGPKLQASRGGREGRIQFGPDDLEAPNITLQEFGSGLWHFLEGAPVLDETGIKGNFDIKLKFAPEENTNSPLPSIFTALQEQLGLKLVSAKVPLDRIIVDHVDRVPTAN